MIPTASPAPSPGGCLALAALVMLGLLSACTCQQPERTPAAAGTWWEDRDGDGYGDPASTVQTPICPAFYADPARGRDCDDSLSTVNPGSCDVAGNGRDEDCSGADGPGKGASGQHDRDGDGYSSKPGFCSDCNDSDGAIHPGAADSTRDGVDQNCDGRDGPLSLRGAHELEVGQLVITELFLGSDARGRDQWFEVFNASGARLSTAGLRIRDSAGGEYLIKDAREVRAFGLVVFSAGGRLRGSLAYRGIRLRRQGALELVANGRTVDRVDWRRDSSFPFARGASTTLYPWYINANKNDLGRSWCLGRSRGHFSGLGTPGQENDLCIPRRNPATAWPSREPPGS